MQLNLFDCQVATAPRRLRAQAATRAADTVAKLHPLADTASRRRNGNRVALRATEATRVAMEGTEPQQLAARVRLLVAVAAAAATA